MSNKNGSEDQQNKLKENLNAEWWDVKNHMEPKALCFNMLA